MSECVLIHPLGDLSDLPGTAYISVEENVCTACTDDEDNTLFFPGILVSIYIKALFPLPHP